MSVYRILTTPDGVLREKARPVKNFNDGVHRLLDNMLDTLRVSDEGVGLAAPQIGVSKRIIVVNLDFEDGEDILELINPEIFQREGEQNAAEGCLSVPGLIGWVDRSQKVKVKAQDRHGKEFEREFADFAARLIQHEIDHLDGILFVDKATRTKKVD